MLCRNGLGTICGDSNRTRNSKEREIFWKPLSSQKKKGRKIQNILFCVTRWSFLVSPWRGERSSLWLLSNSPAMYLRRRQSRGSSWNAFEYSLKLADHAGVSSIDSLWKRVLLCQSLNHVWTHYLLVQEQMICLLSRSRNLQRFGLNLNRIRAFYQDSWKKKKKTMRDK